MKPYIVLHTEWQSLEPHFAQWSAWARSQFMSDWMWLRAWWQAYSRNANSYSLRRRLAVATVHDSVGRLLGIGPFYVGQGIANRSLRLLGDGLAASDYVGVVAPAEHVETVARSLAHWVHSGECRERFGAIDLLECEGQLSSAEWLTGFADELSRLGWRSHRLASDAAWRMNLPSDWTTYVRKLSHSHRRKVNKIVKQRNSGATRIEWVADLRSLEQWWPRFIALHQRRRNELGQPGCFSDPRFGDFLGTAVEQAIARGEACLIGATVQNQPIACGVFFQSGDTWSLYQCGMNSRYEQYEPGHLINAVAIETAIARGARVFDFLRGDEPYKRLWRAERQPLWRCRIVSPQWQSRLKHSAWWAARQVKRASQILAAAWQSSGKRSHVSSANPPIAD